MNLPNALTVGRIAVTPLIAVLPFSNSWALRLLAFVLFLGAATSDYVDGELARSRKQETDLGRLLDPLADKLLLVGMMIPMYFLAPSFPFVTPFGNVGLPLWVVAIVLGRELFMTIFRQIAARRGIVIAAIRAAKWKTGVQLGWQGAAYCWFFARTAAIEEGWKGGLWHSYELLNGTLASLAMITAVALTIYSLVLYLRAFSGVFAQGNTRAATSPKRVP